MEGKTTSIWVHLVQGHVCSSPSLPPPLTLPFKCDKKGSWPARHFLSLTPPPPHWIWDRYWQPRQKSRMASILEVVSMIADFGQQQ
jgi:hypothetical protein